MFYVLIVNKEIIVAVLKEKENAVIVKNDLILKKHSPVSHGEKSMKPTNNVTKLKKWLFFYLLVLALLFLIIWFGNSQIQDDLSKFYKISDSIKSDINELKNKTNHLSSDIKSKVDRNEIMLSAFKGQR